jgi:hypothetical protein
MSIAPTGLSVTDPQTYRARLFTLVGDRDPLDILAQTASRLTEIVRTNPAGVLRTRQFDGKWTANEIIGHLADGECVHGYRLRLILSEDNPVIIGTNQDVWVAALQHNEREAMELVEMFRIMRQFNLALFKALSPANLTRIGQHNERGPESLGVMLRLLAGHDLSHLDQINSQVLAAQPQG